MPVQAFIWTREHLYRKQFGIILGGWGEMQPGAAKLPTPARRSAPGCSEKWPWKLSLRATQCNSEALLAPSRRTGMSLWSHSRLQGNNRTAALHTEPLSGPGGGGWTFFWLCASRMERRPQVYMCSLCNVCYGLPWMDAREVPRAPRGTWQLLPASLGINACKVNTFILECHWYLLSISLLSSHFLLKTWSQIAEMYHFPEQRTSLNPAALYLLITFACFLL